MDDFASLVSYACKLIYLVVLAQKKQGREGRKLVPELVNHLVDLVKCVALLASSAVRG